MDNHIVSKVDERRPPICVVHFASAHHARHSGYHRLAEYLPSHEPLSWNGPRYGTWLTTRIYHHLIRPRCPLEFYSQRSFFTELSLCTKAMRTRRRIFHFIYGENQYWLSCWIKGRRDHRTVATYHQPEALLGPLLGPGYARRSPDAAIVVSRRQMPFFQALVGDLRTYFVPHGIDTDFFRPFDHDSCVAGRPRHCLFVGTWLRDFHTMNEIVRISMERNLDIEFTAITLPSRVQDLRESPNLRVVTEVPDQELVAWYHWADLTILPLLDSTANNSLLESLACGTPVVVTDVGGTRDYTDRSCTILTPPNAPEEMLYAMERLFCDHRLLHQMGVAARAHALQFDWRAIADQTCDVYDKVMRS